MKQIDVGEEKIFPLSKDSYSSREKSVIYMIHIEGNLLGLYIGVSEQCTEKNSTEVLHLMPPLFPKTINII